MPTATEPQPWYLAERAESLAIVSLTENPGIEILRSSAGNSGLDILVRLLEDGKPKGRFFGVKVKAALSQQSQQRDFKTYDLGHDKGASLRDVPFPVCLMLFAVDSDQGYWGWIRQPIAGDERQPSLELHEQVALRELSKASVNGIVSEVTGWYDRLSGQGR